MTRSRLLAVFLLASSERWSAPSGSISGRVYVRFVVDTTGAVAEPFVARGLTAGADAVALACVREALRPGRRGGFLVNKTFSLPVTFGKG